MIANIAINYERWYQQYRCIITVTKPNGKEQRFTILTKNNGWIEPAIFCQALRSIAEAYSLDTTDEN